MAFSIVTLAIFMCHFYMQSIPNNWIFYYIVIRKIDLETYKSSVKKQDELKGKRKRTMFFHKRSSFSN